MELNRELKRLLNSEKIQKLKVQLEQKVGRPISDDEFLQGCYLVLQQSERSKKKYV